MGVFLGRWKDSYVALFSAYFDASGAPDDCDAVVVAGFIAEAGQWVEFERNWQDALRAFEVSGLHMKEYAHSLKEFSSWRGDQKRRAAFLERLVSIVKIRTLHSFVTAVMMDGYREVDKRYCLSETQRPFAPGGISCVDKVRKWAAQQNIPQNSIAYFFEDGDKDKGNLTQALERHYDLNPIYLKKTGSCAFQAADLLA
jgi:hypothetical protein